MAYCMPCAVEFPERMAHTTPCARPTSPTSPTGPTGPTSSLPPCALRPSSLRYAAASNVPRQHAPLFFLPAVEKTPA
jgi:hypothetical protein